jgi:hypothetical protein
MREIATALFLPRVRHAAAVVLAALLAIVGTPAGASAQQESIHFSANENVTDLLVQQINKETVRLDISSWYVSEHSISIAIANRWAAGVPVRIIGDRAALFENDPHTKAEFYWLANQGIPIRLRFNPTWFPEINHWKMALFIGQGIVEFGSGNFAPTELAPDSPTNFDDDSEMFTADPELFNAFKTKFDVMWNDTTKEPESIISAPPYLKDWNDACANEPTGGCADYHTMYPNPAPMTINTARLEGDNPMPVDLIWGQGSDFNNRLVQEINKENSRIDLLVYRLEVDNITEAILAKFQAGVPIRLIVDPVQYTKITWPEYWLTHANIDKLWAAGVPIIQSTHAGVMHMKTLVTSTYASNASSNFGANWQRDHDYFVSASTKPTIYQAIANRVDAMWNDTQNYGPLQITPPNAADLASPASGSAGVAGNTSLIWNTAAWAVSYDVYLGTTQSNMTLVGNVPAQMVQNPPTTYSWTPTTSLQPGTNYFWKIVSRTNATPLLPNMIATSSIWSFATAGAAGPPAAPTLPSPSDGSTGVSTTPTLGWAAGAVGTTYDVAIGQTNPPTPVATGLSSPSLVAGTLSANTTYYWRVTTVSNGFSTAGAVWSFVTGTGTGGSSAPEVVIYASDVAASDVHGAWTQVADASAAAGDKLSDPDAGAATIGGPLAAPADYFDATFQAAGATRYRLWIRMHAIANSKLNDSVFVQFSDSTDGSGNAIYRMNTTGGLLVNLATDSGASSLNGWGWQRNAYWLSDTGDVWFQNGGLHTIRVQVREDGVEIDQIVLSPVTYANNPPGPVGNDNTIVAKPSVPPSAPGLPSPSNGTSGVDVNATLTWSASGATSYDVSFGTSTPPPLVAPGTPAASFPPGTMSNGTTYFWQVTAHNASGSTTGAVWTFTTASAAPPPPGAPASPSPSSGSTGVGTSALLGWSATGATSYDVKFGTANPPAQVVAGQPSASYSPSSLAAGTTYFWQIVAHNGSGSTSGPVWSFTTGSAASDIVIYADDASNTRHGSWTLVSDATAADGRKLVTPDNGWSTTDSPLASPTDYVDATFTAAAGTPYTFWIRLQALNNSKSNDAVWVQFSDAQASGSPIYQIGSTNGLLVNLATDASGSSDIAWGWVNSAYWLSQPVTVTFAAGGTHTVRVQLREDGVEFDQIVLSPSTYLSAAPGVRTNDSTIVPKMQAPESPASPTPATGATNVGTTQTLTWTATGANTFDVNFGTSNPPASVVTGQSATSYSPAGLANSTTYFWQIVAHNSAGTTSGPVWSFTTAAAGAPPSSPASPQPSDASANVMVSPTLTWSASGATTFDVSFGTTNPPAVVASGMTSTSFTPSALANSTTYFWQVVAHNANGSRTGPVWSFTTAAAAPPNTDVVIYASDIPSSALHGSWSRASDPSSPNATKLVTPDNGVANTDAALAAPTDYVDVTFTANAGVPYRLWLRMQALGNSKFNDSLWVQFSDALSGGSSIYPMNTTSSLDVNLATDATGASDSGWGWQNGAYWLSQPTTVTFATSGTHTMRIQVREDGVEFDQIVLSHGAFLTAAPGGVSNDSTIVPKS